MRLVSDVTHRCWLSTSWPAGPCSRGTCWTPSRSSRRIPEPEPGPGHSWHLAWQGRGTVSRGRHFPPRRRHCCSGWLWRRCHRQNCCKCSSWYYWERLGIIFTPWEPGEDWAWSGECYYKQYSAHSRYCVRDNLTTIQTRDTWLHRLTGGSFGTKICHRR